MRSILALLGVALALAALPSAAAEGGADVTNGPIWVCVDESLNHGCSAVGRNCQAAVYDHGGEVCILPE